MAMKRTQLIFQALTTTVALLFALPSSAGAPVEGNLTTSMLESEGNTIATGDLGIIWFHQHINGAPLAIPSFSLNASRLVIESDHVDHYIQGTTYVKRPETNTIYDGGPATLTGTSNRVAHRLWIIPLEGKPLPSVEIHASDAQVSPPSLEELVLVPHVKPDRGNVVTNTRHHASWTGSEEVQATLRGDFLLVAWEWDARLDTPSRSQIVRSGVQGPAAEQQVGSADEVWITAHDATLTIPLRPDTYNLYLDAARLEANGTVSLHRAQGTVSNVAGPVRGELQLQGDLAVDVGAQGVDRPLLARIQGDAEGATINGVPLSLEAPAAPGDPSLAPWSWLAVAGLALAGIRYGRPYWHGSVRRTPHADAPPRGVRARLSAGLWVLAASALRSGRPRIAQRRAKRSLRWNPRNVMATFILAGCRAVHYDYETAMLHYGQVAERARTSRWRTTAIVGEAEMLARMGKTEMAEELLFQAMREDPAWAALAANARFWDEFEGRSTVALVRMGHRRDARS